MKVDIKKIITNKKVYLPLTVLAVLVVVFIITSPVMAQSKFVNTMGDVVVALLSWVFTSIIYVVGNLLLKAIDILIKVLSYSDFINAPIVEKGWVVLRDTANIGITMVILLLAFFNMFRKGSYNYAAILPKLVIAAVLINFSRTITGFFIDIGQMFMMTFVNAFKDTAAGNLTYGFGIEDLLAFREVASGGLIGSGQGFADQVNNWSVFGSVVLATLMVVIALGVVMALVVMMLWRILMLWFLLLTSPVAFLAGILPGGIDNRYGKQWWGELNKYVVMGPVAAFFLWLSFAVISEMTTEQHLMTLQLKSGATTGAANVSDPGWQAFVSKVSSTQRLVDYLVCCGLLIMTLSFAAKSGAKGSEIAGNFLGKLQGYGRTLASWPQKQVQGRARDLWRSTLGVPAYTKEIGKAYGKFRDQNAFTRTVFGTTKDYKERQQARHAARAEQFIGRDKEAMDRFNYRQTMALAKKMEDEGKIPEDVNALKSLTQKSIEEGKLDKAKAYMTKLAEKGDKADNKELIGTFKDKFGKDNFLFDAWARTQEGKGDKLARMYYGVETSPQGKLEEIDATTWLHNKIAKADTADVGSLATNIKESDPQFTEILSTLQSKPDLGFISFKDREKIGDKAANFLALVKEGIAVLPEGVDETKVRGFIKKMYSQKWDRDTGRILTMEDFTNEQLDKMRSEEKIKLENGKKKYEDTVEEVDSGRRFENYTTTQQKGWNKEQSFNREKLSSVDLAAINEVYNKDENSRKALYELVSVMHDLRQNLRNGKDAVELKKVFEQALTKYRNSLDTTSVTSQIDPVTNKPYNQQQLFDFSRFGQSTNLFLQKLDAKIADSARTDPKTGKPKNTVTFNEEKEKGEFDQILSYSTSHARAATNKGETTLKDINAVKKSQQLLAGSINDFINTISTETDKIKRDGLWAKMHLTSVQLKKESQGNQDENYAKNIAELLKGIEELKDNKGLNDLAFKNKMEEIKRLTSQIRTYNNT